MTFLGCLAAGPAWGQPLVFPLPQQMDVRGGTFTIDESTRVLLPEDPSSNDVSLARLLVRHLSDRHRVALSTERTARVPPDGSVIVLGTVENPLVKEHCAARDIAVTAESPGIEGYVLTVDEKRIVVAGWDEAGAFYGLQSLRQLIREDDGVVVPRATVRDWPEFPFRGIRLFVPGVDDIPFFKRFLSDFMALYKFNKLLLEINCMRLDRHPELSAGWLDFAEFMRYTRATEVSGITGTLRNSSHQDAGDGGIVEKADVAGLVRFAGEHHIEVIPEIPSLTHSYYLLTRHPELAEHEGALWPDTYCPSNPATYDLLFDVLDEYIEATDPRMIHIGHDEWWGAPLGVCPRCRSEDPSTLFADDVRRIYDYLKERGVATAIWGDYLLESVRGAGPQEQTSDAGVTYEVPGALPPSVVSERIPKDILVFNWFWKDREKELEVQSFGFRQAYGNLKPNIGHWPSRTTAFDLVGGAPSSWAVTNELVLGKDLLLDFLGCANLLWSSHTLDESELGREVRRMIPAVRRGLRLNRPPSALGDPVVPIDISPWVNLSADAVPLGVELGALRAGEVGRGGMRFELRGAGSGSEASILAVGVEGEEESPLPGDIGGIQVNEDVSSLIFLHACARPAGNQKAYFNTYDPFDTADLLGWYEIVYEDGFVESVPIRYGVNILEWNPGGETSLDRGVGGTGSPQRAYCYEADPVECSANPGQVSITFYAFEWVNVRLGKTVKEVNLRGSVGYRGVQPDYSRVATEVIPSNAIMLVGLSKVQKRPRPLVDRWPASGGRPARDDRGGPR